MKYIKINFTSSFVFFFFNVATENLKLHVCLTLYFCWTVLGLGREFIVNPKL